MGYDRSNIITILGGIRRSVALDNIIDVFVRKTLKDLILKYNLTLETIQPELLDHFLIYTTRMAWRKIRTPGKHHYLPGEMGPAEYKMLCEEEFKRRMAQLNSRGIKYPQK